MYTAIKEFSSTRGLFKPGDDIKVKNQAILDRWVSMGFIEKVNEDVEDHWVDRIFIDIKDPELKVQEISDSKPRISEI